MTRLLAGSPIAALDSDRRDAGLAPSSRASEKWAAVAGEFRECATKEPDVVASQLLLDIASAYDALARHVAALESLGVVSEQAGDGDGIAHGTETEIDRSPASLKSMV